MKQNKPNKIKKLIHSIVKKNKTLRKLARSIKRKKEKLEYNKTTKKFTVDNNTVIFESYMGRSYACSPKSLYLEMKSNIKYIDYNFIWAFVGKEKYKHLEDKRTKVIEYASKEYYESYAVAKYWITNSRIPEGIEKKDGQIYVQCWHGTPFKRLGFDIKVEGLNALNSMEELCDKYEYDAKKYDYLISPSKFCTEKFISCFNLKKLNKQGIIIEKGYPRNDSLFKAIPNEIAEMKKNLGLPKNKKIVLYAPTWRDNQHTSGLGYTYKLGIDFDEFKKKLGDEYIILFRAHYFISNSFDFKKYKGFVYNVSEYDDIADLYILSDILVTDYSSVFFDFANLKKPIMFYMYDLNEYQNKMRDFYFSLEELPGPIIKTQKELEQAFVNIKKYGKIYNKSYNEFNDKFNYLDGNDCSKKVLEEIINDVN